MKEIEDKIYLEAEVFKVPSIVTIFLFLQAEGRVLWH